MPDANLVQDTRPSSAQDVMGARSSLNEFAYVFFIAPDQQGEGHVAYGQAGVEAGHMD